MNQVVQKSNLGQLIATYLTPAEALPLMLVSKTWRRHVQAVFERSLAHFLKYPYSLFLGEFWQIKFSIEHNDSRFVQIDKISRVLKTALENGSWPELEPINAKSLDSNLLFPIINRFQVDIQRDQSNRIYFFKMFAEDLLSPFSSFPELENAIFKKVDQEASEPEKIKSLQLWVRTIAELNCWEALGALIQRPDSILGYSKHQWNCIHLAAKKNCFESLLVLLQRGANPNLKGANGLTPMHIAAKDDNVEGIELLIRFGADAEPNNDLGEAPLHIAAQMGSIRSLKKLTEIGLSVDVKTFGEQTPLHYAVEHAQKDACLILLRAGARVDMQDRIGQTPLHIAVLCEQKNQAEELLRWGASPNILDRCSYSPLHRAVSANHVAMAKMLIENRANPHLRGPQNLTPYEIAVLKGFTTITRMIDRADGRLDSDDSCRII